MKCNFSGKVTDIENSSKKQLLAKKTFFGHKSVGDNLLNGFNELCHSDSVLKKIAVIDLSEKNEIRGPGLYHKKIGKNFDPKSKCDAFSKFLFKDKRGEKLDLAFFKFCFVDINIQSDVDDIFHYYSITIDRIKEEFPNLKIAHVTVPLTVHNFTIKEMIKNLLEGDQANVKRNKFNQMLIEKFSGIDHIFDLANAESRFPDNGRQLFNYKGHNYYSMIKEYSDDGGHLNEFGQKWAGLQFLDFLIDCLDN